MIPLALTLAIAAPVVEVRVEGDGYLRLARAGRTVYATKARLTAVSGALGTAEGDLLLPRLAVPASAKELKVDLEGNVRAGSQTLGRIVLAVFPAGTKPGGSAKPTLANPGEGTTGVIRTTTVGATTTGTTTIAVRARTEIETERFTIGDVAAVDGDPTLVAKVAAIDLGASPIVGTTRGLASIHLISRLRLAGLDPKTFTLTVPEGATVLRRAQTIEPARLIDAAREAVKRRHGLDLPLMPDKAQPPLTITPGEATIAAEAGAVGSAGIPVSVSVTVAGKLVASRRFYLLPEGGSAGVRSGESVRVHVVGNGATIELEGKATSSGWIGQTITISVSTGEGGKPTTLSATVKAPGLVEVKA